MRHAHRLQPHAAGTRERCEEDAVTAEQGVLDARHGGDVELHRLLVHADVTGVHAQRVARLQVVDDHLAVELDPRLPLPLEPLQPNTPAPSLCWKPIENCTPGVAHMNPCLWTR